MCMYVCNCTIMQRVVNERLANFSSIFLLTFCCCDSLRLRLVAAAFLVLFVLFYLYIFLICWCCYWWLLLFLYFTYFSMAMRIFCLNNCELLWSLFSLLFSKKKTKNQLQNEQSTRSIAAHTSVKTYCGVQRLAWKWKWQWREHECERKHKPCYPQRHTHAQAQARACSYTSPDYQYVWVCERRAHKVWDSAHTFAAAAVFPALC